MDATTARTAVPKAEALTTTSLGGAALVIVPSGSPPTPAPASPARGEARADLPTRVEVVDLAWSTSIPMAPGAPLGVIRATPEDPIQPTPEAGSPIRLALDDSQHRDAGRWRSPGEPPSPRGADPIAEMTPLDRGPLGEALIRLLDRFGGLGDRGEAPAFRATRLLPIVLALATVEAARRWRRRRVSAGSPRRGPRGFLPNGLA